MPLVATSRKYKNQTDPRLSDSAGDLINGLTVNAVIYKNPEVPVSALTELKTAFDNALTKAANRGRLEIAEKNAAREALIAAMDSEADYVDMACKGDLAKLLASGFQPVSTNRTRRVLDQVQVKEVRNAQSGELQVVVKAQSTAKAYQGRITAVGSEFGPSITFASSRDILFKGLTAGVRYVVQVCAIGGLTGRSDWSDPVERMAM